MLPSNGSRKDEEISKSGGSAKIPRILRRQPYDLAARNIAPISRNDLLKLNELISDPNQQSSSIETSSTRCARPRILRKSANKPKTRMVVPEMNPSVVDDPTNIDASPADNFHSLSDVPQLFLENTEIKASLEEVLRSIDIKSLRPERIRRGAKFTGAEIVKNVFDGLKILRDLLGDVAKDTPFNRITEMTSFLTNVSPTTIKRTLRSPKKPKSNVTKTSRKQRRLIAAQMLTEAQKEHLKDYLDSCWEEQTHVTADSLLEWARMNIGYKHGKTLFYDILHGIGLTYRKKNRNALVEERVDLIAARKMYLDRKSWLGLHKKPFYGFFDETWFFEGMVASMGWQYQNDDLMKLARMARIEERRSGPVAGKDKGKRAIVLSVLTVNGVLDGSAEIIVSGSKEADQFMDYHQEMNAETYREYMEQVVPALAKAAEDAGGDPVMVIDNAPYHNRTIEKIPTKNSNKKELVDFLTSHNVPATMALKKRELGELFEDFVQSNGGRKSFIRYEIDEWALEEHGVEILRLPPYHCCLNPIELLWAQLKNYLRRTGTTTEKLAEVRKRALEWLRGFSADSAQKLIDHIEGFEEDFRKKVEENLIVAAMNQITSDEDSYDGSDESETETSDEDNDDDELCVNY